MLKAVPKGWLSSTWQLTDGSGTLAEMSLHWGQRGTIRAGGAEYEACRDGLLGPFVLRLGGTTVAKAGKAITTRFEICCDDQEYEFKGRFFSRGFDLLQGGQLVGTVEPAGILSRSMIVNLPDSLSLPAKAFIVWLVAMMWRRRNRRASGAH